MEIAFSLLFSFYVSFSKSLINKIYHSRIFSLFPLANLRSIIL